MGLHYVNNMRGIAILLVIFAHALSTVKGEGIVFELLRALVDNCTVVFVAISGYLFTSLSENFRYLNFMKTKAKTVLLPYVIISIPALLMYLIPLKTTHNWIDLVWFHQELNIFEQAAFLLATGAHLGPLWFIPMILVYFTLSPVFIWLKNKNLIPAAFLITLLLAVYFGRPDRNDNALQSFVFFLPPYLLGMWLSISNQWNNQTTQKYIIGGTLAYLVGALLLYHFLLIESSLDLLIKLVFTVIMFVLCAKYLNARYKWVDLFARLSFFLFFVHGYLSGFFRVIYRDLPRSPDNIWLAFLSFGLIIAFCMIGYLIAKPILKSNSKYMIGA